MPDEEFEFLDFHYFITTNETNIFVCDSVASLKTTMEKAKSLTSKTPLVLESFALFKAGLSSYADINLLGVLKAVNIFLKSEEYDEINTEALLNEKLAPIKLGFRMDGNLTFMCQLDLIALKTIAKIVWPLFMEPTETEMIEENPVDSPDTQP